ncbi:MAG: ABC transporter permease [Gemmataceae bacterium]
MANASVQQHVINSKTWGSTLSELSRYRELLWFFIWRDITVKYKQTFLGIAWAVLQPLGTMLIFTLLFGMVAKFPTDGIPAPIFYYAGLLPWTFFTSALTASGNSLVSNKNLISKVYFPRLALPASAVLSGLLDYFLASVILFVLILLYGVTLTWQLCLIPILIVPVVVTALGGGSSCLHSMSSIGILNTSFRS